MTCPDRQELTMNSRFILYRTCFIGAVNAMHDAVVLANALYNMPDSTPRSITAAFQEYYDQRYPRLDTQIKRSKSLQPVMGGKVGTG
jgi:hypothetical protein